MGLTDENEAIYRDVERVVIHPKYIELGRGHKDPMKSDAMYYDIALLKLRKRITPVFNETHYIINSICLPKYNITNSEGERLVMIGMGIPARGVYYWTPQLKKGLGVLIAQSTFYSEWSHPYPRKMKVEFLAPWIQNNCIISSIVWFKILITRPQNNCKLGLFTIYHSIDSY